MRKQQEPLTTETHNEEYHVLEQLKALYYKVDNFSGSSLILDMSILDRCDFLDEDQVAEMRDTYFRAHYTHEASREALRELRAQILYTLVEDLEQEPLLPKDVSKDDLPVDCPGWTGYDQQCPSCLMCDHSIPCLVARSATGRPLNIEIEEQQDLS